MNALGKAFMEAKGIGENGEPQKKTGRVVLIDEIDKAPRDFPNDILTEIEKYCFQVKELKHKEINLSPDERENIFIVMTSNSERNLPEPFLRRCIYFHITFPKPERLKEILVKRLNLTNANDIVNIESRIRDFFKFRKNDSIQKMPTTSECLDYVRILHDANKLDSPLFDSAEKITKDGLDYLSLLLKKKEDRELYVPNNPGQ